MVLHCTAHLKAHEAVTQQGIASCHVSKAVADVLPQQRLNDAVRHSAMDGAHVPLGLLGAEERGAEGGREGGRGKGRRYRVAGNTSWLNRWKRIMRLVAYH